MALIIDSHAHLDTEAFDNDRGAVLERAREAGVAAIVNIGATEGDKGARRSLALAAQHPWIFCTLGVHPHDAAKTEAFAYAELNAHEAKVVAIGETGLDFHYDFATKEEQFEMFKRHIALAKAVKKPLVIHSRESNEECIEFLKQNNAHEVGGVFHCYSDSAAFAERLREINFLVSVPGILTFKKAAAVREAYKEIPLSQIMLETDSPYLAPEPFRGKRCESSYILHTAQVLAEIKGLQLEEIAEATSANALKFFGLPLEFMT